MMIEELRDELANGDYADDYNEVETEYAREQRRDEIIADMLFSEEDHEGPFAVVEVEDLECDRFVFAFMVVDANGYGIKVFDWNYYTKGAKRIAREQANELATMLNM